MAIATLYAAPNPVLVHLFAVEGTTQITWSTMSSAKGRVVYTKEGTPGDNDFDSGTGATKTFGPVGLGTYHFRLHEDDNGRLGKLLRTLILDVIEYSVLPSGIGHHGSVKQGIYDLQVLPGIDWVRIKFKTRQGCHPGVEISETVNNVQVFSSAVPALDVVFDLVVGKARRSPLTPADMGTVYWDFPLELNATFSFKITAPAITGAPSIASGVFTTGSRTATIFFDRFTLVDAGEADDFRFQFFVEDPATGVPLFAEEKWWGFGSLDSGESRETGFSFTFGGNAPRTVAAQAQVTAHDNDIFSEYLGVPQFPVGQDFVTNDDDSFSWDTRVLDLTVAGGFPFQLGAKPGGPVDFTVFGHVDLASTNGRVVELKPVASYPRPPIHPIQWTANLAAQLTPVTLGEGKGKVAARLSGGDLFVASLNGESVKRAQWARVASGVDGAITVARSAGQLHFFNVGHSGKVLHKTYVLGGGSKDEWQPLGEGFAGAVVPVVVSNRVELFGLDREHRILRRTLGGPGKWEVVGEGIAGDVNAFTSPHEEVVVIAAGRNGQILFRRWPSAEVRSDGHTWQSLGQGRTGELMASFVQDIVVLAYVNDHEAVYAAPWRNYPELPVNLHWESVGTVASLLNSRYSVLGPGHVAQAKAGQN